MSEIEELAIEIYHQKTRVVPWEQAAERCKKKLRAEAKRRLHMTPQEACIDRKIEQSMDETIAHPQALIKIGNVS